MSSPRTIAAAAVARSADGRVLLRTENTNGNAPQTRELDSAYSAADDAAAFIGRVMRSYGRAIDDGPQKSGSEISGIEIVIRVVERELTLEELSLRLIHPPRS